MTQGGTVRAIAAIAETLARGHRMHSADGEHDAAIAACRAALKRCEHRHRSRSGRPGETRGEGIVAGPSCASRVAHLRGAIFA
jgi:hypothetical protein